MPLFLLRNLLRSFFATSGDGQRHAFLLANSDYTNLNPLSNPPNDLEATKQAFESLGFKVTARQNLDATNTRRYVEEFLSNIKEQRNKGFDVDDLIFFYSGHGIQLVDQNFIVPIDYDVSRELGGLFNVQDGFLSEAVQLAKNKFVFLDACRDSAGLSRDLLARPRPLLLGPQVSQLAASRSGTMARSSNAATETSLASTGNQIDHRNTNTFIVFSADQDDVALDGRGSTSPFTSALVENLSVRGLDVFDLTQRVARKVRATTASKDWAQIPWVHSNFSRPYSLWPRPSWLGRALASWGALAGIIHFLVSFKASGNGHLKPLEGHGYWLLLSSLTMPIGLGLMVYLWGTPRDWVVRTRLPKWSTAVATTVIAFIVLALCRIWFEYLNPWEFYSKLKPPETCASGWFKCLYDDKNDNMRLLLYVITLPTTLAGLGAAASGAFFVKELNRSAPLAAAALVGFLASACFVVFAAVRAVFGQSVEGNFGVGEYLLILFLVIFWQAALGFIIGASYSRFNPGVAEPKGIFIDLFTPRVSKRESLS
ncbi:MAG: caspase family protein [Filomicrobium sp.]